MVIIKILINLQGVGELPLVVWTDNLLENEWKEKTRHLQKEIQTKKNSLWDNLANTICRYY